MAHVNSAMAAELTSKIMRLSFRDEADATNIKFFEDDGYDVSATNVPESPRFLN